MPTDPDTPWPEKVPIPVDHPLVPPPITDAVKPYLQPGDALHRVPTDRGVEWWLMDAHGELIEAFWLESHPGDAP